MLSLINSFQIPEDRQELESYRDDMKLPTNSLLSLSPNHSKAFNLTGTNSIVNLELIFLFSLFLSLSKFLTLADSISIETNET